VILLIFFRASCNYSQLAYFYGVHFSRLSVALSVTRELKVRHKESFIGVTNYCHGSFHPVNLLISTIGFMINKNMNVFRYKQIPVQKTNLNSLSARN
jgi:hypothetical protein